VRRNRTRCYRRLRRPWDGRGAWGRTSDCRCVASRPCEGDWPFRPSRLFEFRPGRPLGLARHRAEDDFDLHVVEICVLKFHDLVKALLAQGGFGQLEGLVLALDDGPPHGALAFLVALDASFQRRIEDDRHSRHLVFLRQVQQIPACRAGQRRRVHHAKAIQREALIHQEMHQREGLRIETLVALVVTDSAAGPIRRDNLGGPEVALGKIGFPAGRGTAQHNDRGPDQPHRLAPAFGFVRDGF
jgi:hypothetical protein